MKQFDVIIVGAGPCGSILAAGLDPRIRVLVVDRRHVLDTDRIEEEAKCCGGMLDHAAQEELAHLGIGLDRKTLMAPNVFSVRAVDFESRMERFYPRNYLNMDRGWFDHQLLKRASRRPNVTVWQGIRVTGFKEEDDRVLVDFRSVDEDGPDQPARQVSCRYLVGADGASSVIRCQLLKNEKKERLPRNYVAIQEIHEVAKPLPYYMAVFDKRVTDYYSWVIPKGNKILIGAAIPAEKSPKYGTASQRFEYLKEDLTIKGFDLSCPLKRQGCRLLRPRAVGSVNSGGGRVFLAGEAAGLISPSSSEGISFAMRSGEKLAKAMGRLVKSDKKKAKDLIHLRYRQALRPLKLSIFLKTFKSFVMYTPLVRAMVFLTGALSIKGPVKSRKWSL